MKKHVLIVCLLLGMSVMTMAQMGQYNQKAEAVAIGVKGGMNIPQMWYLGNEALGQFEQKMNITPTGGLFVEIPLGSSLAIAPEAMYVQRGTDVEYEHILSGSQVHYSMNVSYADLRLPFEFRLPIKPYFQPYLVAGAEVGMRLFGQIHIQRTSPVELNNTIDVGDANMGLLHAGAFAGVGVRSRFYLGAMGIVLKLSASYHQGLLDTYSVKEKDGAAQPINVNAYKITGSRLPRGLEATLGLAIPLELRPDDACATFSNDHRWIKHNKRGHHGY